MNEFLKEFWNKYSFIHNSTKELYILSEEYEDEMSSFIQPIKEQKDSLEHIVRAYTRYSEKVTNLSDDDEKYIRKNLDKAIGHTFRSFFDCADIFSIIIRENLSKELKRFSYSQIIRVWPEYEGFRKKLVDTPKQIADLRTNKDIAKDNVDIIAMVDEYKKTIYQIWEIYDKYMKNIYPILNK